LSSRALALRGCEIEGGREEASGSFSVERLGAERLLAHGSFRRTPRLAAGGLPQAGVRDLPQDRSPPRHCDASRARPSSDRDECNIVQMRAPVKNKVRTSPRPPPPLLAPSTVIPGLEPGIHVLDTQRLLRRGWPGQARHDEARTTRADKAQDPLSHSGRGDRRIRMREPGSWGDGRQMGPTCFASVRKVMRAVGPVSIRLTKLPARSRV